MEEINYIPNRAPGMLLNAQSYTLGILIPSFQNQLFADILAGIESVTSEHNYQTLIANYNYDRDSEEESVINLLSYNIDGIILSEKYRTIRTVEISAFSHHSGRGIDGCTGRTAGYGGRF